MALTLRLVKGSELTYAELDGNFLFITGSYTPLSVTSSMSVATASNITPAIANNADNRIITSDGDGTFTAESNFTFNGSTARITGSLIVSSSINVIGTSLITGSQTLTGGVNANGGFTGSLLGTSATASNITPAISSDGIDRVLTSNGDGTMTAEANLNFDGSTLNVTGSLTVSGSNTLRNIGPAKFRSSVSNTATTTALEITGGLQVSASINSVNRYLYNSSSVVTTDWQNGKLFHPNNGTTVDWTGYALKASNGITTVNWEGTTLSDQSNASSVDWGGRQLADASSITSIHWGNRYALYSSGLNAFNWGTPGKIFMSGSVTITGSLLVSGSGTLTNIGPARFRSNIANSATTTALEITGGLQVSHSIDSVNRYLYTGITNTPVVKWELGDLALIDVNNQTSMQWSNRYLYNENGGTAIDWNSANSYAPSSLLDASDLASVKWGLRQLVYSSGSTAFNWGTPDKIFMSGSVIVTGSLTVSGSGTLTNIGPARFRGNTANSTTVTAMEITGSSRISGSLVITGSLQVGVGSAPAIDTTVGTLSKSGVRVDWRNNTLVDESAVTSVDWQNRRLTDANAGGSVDWSARELYDSATSASLYWDSRALTDSNGVDIFNWDYKRFRYSNSNSLLNFETPGTVTMFVSASFCVSASGLANATASLSIQTEPNVSDWYTIALRSRNVAASSSIELNKYITISHGAGGAIDMIGDTYFTPGQAVRIYNNTGNVVVQIDPSTVLTSTLTVAGVTRLTNNVHVTGSLSISGSGVSTIILSKVSQSLNFVDDTAAAAGGVPLGGLYRNGSFIMIRVS